MLNPLLVVVGLFDEVIKESAGVELLAVVHQDIKLPVEVVPLFHLLPVTVIPPSFFVASDFTHD